MSIYIHGHDQMTPRIYSLIVNVCITRFHLQDQIQSYKMNN